MNLNMFSALLVATFLGGLRGSSAATTITSGTNAPTAQPPTTVRGNSGATTDIMTGSTQVISGTGTADPDGVIPSFQVTNSGGDVCMLLEFNATVRLEYDTVDEAFYEAEIPVTGTSDFEGSCDSDTSRKFTLWYPSRDLFCAEWLLTFAADTNSTYVFGGEVTTRIIEPCFRSDAVLYNRTYNFPFRGKTYEGTIGKAMTCNSIQYASFSGTFVMDNVKFQPFAQRSADKGHIGEEEKCRLQMHTTLPPARTTWKPFPTFPSPFDAGWIAGVVVGSVTFIISVISLIVVLVKKRPKRRE